MDEWFVIAEKYIVYLLFGNWKILKFAFLTLSNLNDIIIFVHE